MMKIVRNVVNRFKRLGDWLSAGVNSLLLDGCVDESISGRSYRMDVYENNAKWRRLRKFVDTIWRTVFGESDHCRGAYYKDLGRAIQYKNRHEQYMKTDKGQFETRYVDRV